MKREELLDCLKEWGHRKRWMEEWDKRDEQAYQQIVAILKNQPIITEEWIEEKAIGLFKMAMKWFNNEEITSQQKIEIGQGFIRSLTGGVNEKK